MRLKRDNVERVVTREAKIQRLKAAGFKELAAEAQPETAAGTGEGEEAEKAEDVDLSSLTVAQLKELAKDRGLEGYSSLTKEELLRILGEE